jgi:hypothetical protein
MAVFKAFPFFGEFQRLKADGGQQVAAGVSGKPYCYLEGQPEAR